MVCSDNVRTRGGQYVPRAEKAKEEGSSSPATGVPEFWLVAMKNADIFSDWIKVIAPVVKACNIVHFQEHDEPALQRLTEITVVYPSSTGMVRKVLFPTPMLLLLLLVSLTGLYS